MLTHLCLAFLARPAMTMSIASGALGPPERLPLGGYTERGGKLSEPFGDILLTQVLLLRSGTLTVAIVSLEMLTVPESLREEVQKKLSTKINLFLTATHTHCAPDSQMLNRRMTLAIPGIASFRRKWLDWYSTTIATTINKAATECKRYPFDNLTVSEFRLNANRGRRKFASPSTLFTTISNDGIPRIMSYAAHPVNYDASELNFRSDWPGSLMGSTGAIVLNGAIGDVSPNFVGTSPEEKIGWFITRVLSQHPKPRGETTDPFQYFQEPIRFDAPVPHPNFAKDYKIPSAFAESMVKTFAPPKSEITAIRIGKTLILGIPGEPTAEMGQQIIAHARARGFRSPLVISHVNGWAGYMLLPDDYDRGGYEANLSFFGRNGGTQVVEAANRATDKLTILAN